MIEFRKLEQSFVSHPFSVHCEVSCAHKLCRYTNVCWEQEFLVQCMCLCWMGFAEGLKGHRCLDPIRTSAQLWKVYNVSSDEANCSCSMVYLCLWIRQRFLVDNWNAHSVHKFLLYKICRMYSAWILVKAALQRSWFQVHRRTQSSLTDWNETWCCSGVLGGVPHVLLQSIRYVCDWL